MVAWFGKATPPTLNSVFEGHRSIDVPICHSVSRGSNLQTGGTRRRRRRRKMRWSKRNGRWTNQKEKKSRGVMREKKRM